MFDTMQGLPDHHNGIQRTLIVVNLSIDFGDENVIFSYPIDDMVQQLNGIQCV